MIKESDHANHLVNENMATAYILFIDSIAVIEDLVTSSRSTVSNVIGIGSTMG